MRFRFHAELRWKIIGALPRRAVQFQPRFRTWLWSFLMVVVFAEFFYALRVTVPICVRACIERLRQAVLAGLTGLEQIRIS